MTDYEILVLVKIGAAMVAYFISLALAYQLGKLRILMIWQRADEADEAAKEAEEDEMLQDMERMFKDHPRWTDQFREEDFEDGSEEL